MQQILQHGTSLLILPIDEGVAVAADDLVYETRDGVAIPAFAGVHKVFAASERVIIGATQNMWIKLAEPISFEYQIDKWIAEFIPPQSSSTECDPEEVATRIYNKARQTFEPIDSLIREGKWNKQAPGETFVNYLVAGYAKDFRQHSLFNIWVRLDADGKGLDFLPPDKKVTQFGQLSWYGEDQFFLRAKDGLPPEAGLFKRRRAECSKLIDRLLPNIHPRLKESTAYIAALIKVEAYFNKNKVGRSVKLVVIDRDARRSYSAVL
jgi:hypothetical protein